MDIKSKCAVYRFDFYLAKGEIPPPDLVKRVRDYYMTSSDRMPPRFSEFLQKLDSGQIKRPRGNKYQKINRSPNKIIDELRLADRVRRWQQVLKQRPALKRRLQPEQSEATYNSKKATPLQIALRIVSNQSGVPAKTLEKWLAR